MLSLHKSGQNFVTENLHFPELQDDFLSWIFWLQTALPGGLQPKNPAQKIILQLGNQDSLSQSFGHFCAEITCSDVGLLAYGWLAIWLASHMAS